MKKEIRLGIFSLLFVISALATYYLYSKELVTYSIIVGTISLICAILILSTILFYKNGEDHAYYRDLHQILKVYDAILVESDNLPDLVEKDIIKITSIKELVDAQLEIRKPIFYKIEEETCSFVLLDQGTALIFILRMNEESISSIDSIVKEKMLSPDVSTGKVVVTPSEEVVSNDATIEEEEKTESTEEIESL